MINKFGVISIHRSDINVLTTEQKQLVLTSLKILESTDYPPNLYKIIKIDTNNSIVSFIESFNWDSAREPIVGNAYNVNCKGNVTITKQKKDPKIYHHKWMFVADNYKGFDVEQSKEWSEIWQKAIPLTKEIEGKIQYKGYWEGLLKKHGLDGKIKPMITTEEKETKNIECVNDVEEIIDYLIEELKVKELLIEELEELNNSQNDKNEIPVNVVSQERNVSDETQNSVIIPLDIINIYIAYPLMITYMKNGYMNEFNKVLETITFEDLQKLNLDNVETIVKYICKYVDKVESVSINNMSGVNITIREILKFNINRLLKYTFDNLLSKKHCIDFISEEVLLEYAIKYFINDYMEESKYLLSYIVNYEKYKRYNRDDIINLIMLSAYFNQCDKLLKKKGISTILNEPNNKDGYFINKLINNNKYIDQFGSFEEMKLHIKNCNLVVARKIYEKLSILNKEIQEVYISKSRNVCEFDNANLIIRNRDIAIYDMQQNNKTRVLESKVLWCEKCHKYSLNNKLLQEIYKLLNVNEGIKFINIGGLNQMSPLMIMGYSTNVNKDKRWNLLEKRIIPTLGVNKVVKHISFLINFNKNKVNKDFSRSLMEWETDLNKIKKKYRVF